MSIALSMAVTAVVLLTLIPGVRTRLAQWGRHHPVLDVLATAVLAVVFVALFARERHLGLVTQVMLVLLVTVLAIALARFNRRRLDTERRG